MSGIPRIGRKLCKILLLIFSALAVQLLAIAVLVERGVLPEDAMEVVTAVALILAGILGSFQMVKDTGEVQNGFFVGAVFYGLLLVVGFAVTGLNWMRDTGIRSAVAVFSGSIIGNLFGRRKYYKLRNSRRKKKFTTK